MKSKLKLAPIAIVALVAITLIFSNNVNDAINARDRQEAFAIDPASSTISPELREVVAKAGPNELIRVWVEFDSDEYANKTGTRIVPLVKRYKIAAVEKMRNKAYDKFLPEEVIALIYCGFYSKGVDPPIELVEKRPYLVWYIEKLTAAMIESIADFPGIQKITLFKLPTEIPKVDPILISYVEKVAEEYPEYRIMLHIRLRGYPLQWPTGEVSYDRVREIVERYRGSITYSHGNKMRAVALPNIQLVMELASLQEVSSIYPNWVYYAGW